MAFVKSSTIYLTLLILQLSCLPGVMTRTLKDLPADGLLQNNLVSEELASYVGQKLKGFRLDLHRSFETSRLRQKRVAGSIVEFNDRKALEPERISVIQDDSPNEHHALGHILCWTAISTDTSHYILMVTSSNQLVLFSYGEYSFRIILQLKVQHTAVEAHAFFHRNQIWFLINYHKPEGFFYVQMYSFNGKNFFMKQKIQFGAVADVDLLLHRGVWYLTVGVATGFQVGQVRLYEWRNTQFDLIATTPCNGIESIVSWDFAGIIYLAVTGYKDNLEEGSLIYSYHKRNGRNLAYVQQLSGVYAPKAVHYLIGRNHYLLFLVKDSAAIYWWTGHELILYQTLSDTANVEFADVLPFPNGEVALAIAHKSSVTLWTEDSTSNFVKSLTVNIAEGLLLASVGFIYHPNLYYHLFATYKASGIFVGKSQFGGSVWNLNLSNHVDDHDNLDVLSSCLASLDSNILNHKKQFNTIDSIADRIWVTNKKQTIQTSVIIKGNMEAVKPLMLNSVIISSNATSVSPLTTSKLSIDILNEHGVVNSMEVETEGLVFKSKKQAIRGPLTFSTSPTFGTASVALKSEDFVLNGVKISQLGSALKWSGNQIFQSDVTVANLSSMNITLDGKLNDIRFQDLFLLGDNKQITVTGKLDFHNISLQELNIAKGGTINSIQPESIVLSNKPQTIAGHKIFANLIVKNDVGVNGHTNGRNLSAFCKEIISINESETVTLDIEFSAPLKINGDLHINKLHNDLVDLTKLVNDALLLDGNQKVIARKIFKQPVAVFGDIQVEGLTNGIDVDRDVFTLDTPQNVSSTMTFLQPINFKGDLETVSVNDLHLGEDAVTSAGLQQITGHKTFSSPLKILGDVTIAPNSLINSAKIWNLGRLMATESNFTLFGPVTVFNEMTTDYVDFISEINGKAIDGPTSEFWRKSFHQEIPTPLSFSKPLTFNKGMKVKNFVNGLNLDSSFVHTFGNEYIDGTLSFVDDVIVKSPLQMDSGVRLNNYDITSYGNLIIKSHSSSTIHGHKTFKNIVVLGNIVVNRSMNGVPSTEKFLLSSKYQEIVGHIHFESSVINVFGNVLVDDVDLQEDISGIKFSKFAQEIVLQNDTRNIPIEFKTFSSPLKVGKMNAAGTIDGVDVTDLKRRAVPLHTTFSHFAAYNFTDLTIKTNILLKNFNGQPLQDFIDKIVFHEETEIRGSKIILGSAKTLRKVFYQGTFNGLDLPKLVKETATKTTNNFSSPVTVIGDLIIERIILSDSTKIDGVPWSDLSFLHKEESFTGNNIFLDDIVAKRRVLVDGPINECSVKDVVSQLIYNDQKEQIVERQVSIGQLEVKGNLTVRGDINNINVNRLALEMVTRSDPQKLTGEIVFKSGLIVKKLILKSGINAVDLNFILADTVSKSQPQVISGVKTFSHTSGLALERNVTMNGNVYPKYVDGLDITRLHETTVLNFVEQTIRGKKRFSDVVVLGDVYVQGYLNGINFPAEVVLLESTDDIPIEMFVLGHTSISGSVFATKLVDGINLNKTIARRVSLSQQEIVSAELNFLENIQSKQLYVTGTINDIPASSIITRSHNYIINGPKYIAGDVVVEGSMEGCLINNLSVSALKEQIVRIDKEEIVSGATIFITPLEVTRNIVVESSINGLQIHALQNDLAMFNHQLTELSKRVIDVTDSQELVLGDLLQNYETCDFRLFSYFDVVQILDVPTVKIFSSPVSVIQNPLAKSISSRHLFGWAPDVCNDFDHCCSLSTVSIGFNEAGLLIVLEKNENQRLFPFIFDDVPATSQAIHGFLFWTNSTSFNPECSSNLPEETKIMTLIGGGDNHLPGASGNPFHIPRSSHIQDVKLFEIQGQFYIVIAHFQDITMENQSGIEVYRYRRDLDDWLLHQSISGIAVNDIDIVELDFGETRQTNCVLLAVASRPPGVSAIYTWIMELAKFELLNNVPSSWPSSVLWVAIKESENVYAVFANEKSVLRHGVPVYSEPLVIYLYDHENKRILHWQNIPMSGISSLDTFNLAGETYILAGSSHSQLIYVIQWKGYSGFKVIQEFPVPGLRDLHAYWSPNNELYLMVSSVCGTTILKAVTQGLRLSNDEVDNYVNLLKNVKSISH